jgi:hypothetical protein
MVLRNFFRRNTDNKPVNIDPMFEIPNLSSSIAFYQKMKKKYVYDVTEKILNTAAEYQMPDDMVFDYEFFQNYLLDLEHVPIVSVFNYGSFYLKMKRGHGYLVYIPLKKNKKSNSTNTVGLDIDDILNLNKEENPLDFDGIHGINKIRDKEEKIISPNALYYGGRKKKTKSKRKIKRSRKSKRKSRK